MQQYNTINHDIKHVDDKYQLYNMYYIQHKLQATMCSSNKYSTIHNRLNHTNGSESLEDVLLSAYTCYIIAIVCSKLHEYYNATEYYNKSIGKCKSIIKSLSKINTNNNNDINNNNLNDILLSAQQLSTGSLHKQTSLYNILYILYNSLYETHTNMCAMTIILLPCNTSTINHACYSCIH